MENGEISDIKDDTTESEESDSEEEEMEILDSETSLGLDTAEILTKLRDVIAANGDKNSKSLIESIETNLSLLRSQSQIGSKESQNMQNKKEASKVIEVSLADVFQRNDSNVKDAAKLSSGQKNNGIKSDQSNAVSETSGASKANGVGMDKNSDTEIENAAVAGKDKNNKNTHTENEKLFKKGKNSANSNENARTNLDDENLSKTEPGSVKTKKGRKPKKPASAQQVQSELKKTKLANASEPSFKKADQGKGTTQRALPKVSKSLSPNREVRSTARSVNRSRMEYYLNNPSPRLRTDESRGSKRDSSSPLQGNERKKMDKK